MIVAAMPNQLERAVRKIRQRTLGDLAPVGGQLFFAGHHGVRQELQDILAWDTAAPFWFSIDPLRIQVFSERYPRLVHAGDRLP